MSGHAAKNATGHSATLDPIMDEVYIRSAQAAQARRQRARNSPILPCRSVSVVRVFLRKSGYGSWTVV